MLTTTKPPTLLQPAGTEAGDTNMLLREAAAGQQPVLHTTAAPRMVVPLTAPGNPLTRTPPAQNPLNRLPIGEVQEFDSRSELDEGFHQMRARVAGVLPRRSFPNSDGNGWDRVERNIGGDPITIYPNGLLGHDIVLINTDPKEGFLTVKGGTVSRVNSGDNGITVSISSSTGVENIPFDDFKPVATRNALWVREMPEAQKPLTGNKIVDAAPLGQINYITDRDLRTARENLKYRIGETGKWREVLAEEHAQTYGGDLYPSHFVGKTAAVLNEPGTGTAEFLVGEITDLRFVLPPHQDQYGRPSGHYEMTIRDARTGAQIQIRNVENFYLPKQEGAR